MTIALAHRSPTDIVRSEAWKFGIDLPETAAEYVLWNYTGFPSFYPDGTTPEEHFAAQAYRFFEYASQGCVPCYRCGERAEPDLFPVCWKCELEVR